MQTLRKAPAIGQSLRLGNGQATEPGGRSLSESIGCNRPPFCTEPPDAACRGMLKDVYVGNWGYFHYIECESGMQRRYGRTKASFTQFVSSYSLNSLLPNQKESGEAQQSHALPDKIHYILMFFVWIIRPRNRSDCLPDGPSRCPNTAGPASPGLQYRSP